MNSKGFCKSVDNNNDKLQLTKFSAYVQQLASGVTIEELKNKNVHKKIVLNQPQKAIAVAIKGKLGWQRALSAAINDILGGKSANRKTLGSRKKPFDDAMMATGAARNAQLRMFASPPKRPAEFFKWEQRSLDVLAVYYANKYQFDKKRDSETLAHAICKEASELFCEQILQPAVIVVSIVDEC